MTTFESLLARLLADPDLRERFRIDRDAMFEELDVPMDVRRAFESIDSDALDTQAEGLVSKRRHEVAALLPRTFAALEADAEGRFREFAAGFWPAGHRRHPVDAWEFCRFLERSGPPVVDAAERNRVRFLARNRSFALHVVRRHGRLALQCLYRRRGRLVEHVRRFW